MKQILFSIHGIRKTGDWQDGVAAILSPHFDYRPVHYSEYRRIAILKLSGDLIFMLVAAVTMYRCRGVHWLTLSPHLYLCILGVLALAGLIHISLRSRMNALVIKIHEKMTDDVPLGAAPSVIAHSLGTYLVCAAFQKYEDMLFHTVLLDGCVVARTYPWVRMVLRFENVFNEIAGKDWIPYFAGLLKFTMPGMGTAGAIGFKGPVVGEAVLNPSSIGPICDKRGPCCSSHGSEYAKLGLCVYNIRHGHLRHGGYHEGVTHAKGFWLPRLFGYDPVLYRNFYTACRKVVETEDGLKSRQQSARESLFQSCWGWTRGSLEAFARAELELIGGNAWGADCIEALLTVSLYNLCVLTTEAVETFYKERPVIPSEHWRFLDPITALHRSIVASIKQAREQGMIA